MGPETGPRIKVADRGPAQEPAPRPPDTLRGALLAAAGLCVCRGGFRILGRRKGPLVPLGAVVSVRRGEMTRAPRTASGVVRASRSRAGDAVGHAARTP